MPNNQSKTVPVSGGLKMRVTRQRSPKTYYNEDLGTPGMRAAAALVPGYTLDPTKKRRGGRLPKVPVAADELFRLAQLQVTQEEAAGYFLVSSRRMEQILQQPEMRDAWEAGLARGRVSFRQLGMRHANGTGAAAVAAWIHQSKFVLGYSEKLLNGPGGDLSGGPGEGSGALERFFGRIARLVEQRAAGGAARQLILEGGDGPGMELGILGSPEADGAEPVELAPVVDPGRPWLREVAHGGGDGAASGGERPIGEDLPGGAHGLGHPRRDDRGGERDNEDLSAVEQAEIRADKEASDMAERRSGNDV